jgi:hypothetical protein
MDKDKAWKFAHEWLNAWKTWVNHSQHRLLYNRSFT